MDMSRYLFLLISCQFIITQITANRAPSIPKNATAACNAQFSQKELPDCVNTFTGGRSDALQAIQNEVANATFPKVYQNGFLYRAQRMYTARSIFGQTTPDEITQQASGSCPADANAQDCEAAFTLGNNALTNLAVSNNNIYTRCRIKNWAAGEEAMENICNKWAMVYVAGAIKGAQEAIDRK